MKELYLKLYKIYISELHKLNIGYTFEKDKTIQMFDILNAIDYIENGDPTVTEIYKIIAYYE